MEGKGHFDSKDIEIPWGIRHQYLLLLFVILLILALITTFILAAFFFPIFVLTIISAIALVLTTNVYSQSARYAEIVKALQHDLISVKLDSSFLRTGILKIRSRRYGQFSLVYIPSQGEHGGGLIYRLW
jgi:hypothetical protein